MYLPSMWLVCVHITFILFNPIQYSKLNYVDEYK